MYKIKDHQVRSKLPERLNSCSRKRELPLKSGGKQTFIILINAATSMLCVCSAVSARLNGMFQPASTGQSSLNAQTHTRMDQTQECMSSDPQRLPRDTKSEHYSRRQQQLQSEEAFLPVTMVTAAQKVWKHCTFFILSTLH